MSTDSIPKPNRLLTTKQAADYLGLPVSTVRHLAKADRVRHMTIPGPKRVALRFRPEDLDVFLRTLWSGPVDDPALRAPVDQVLGDALDAMRAAAPEAVAS